MLNLQGDIIQIVDASGNVVVEYTYDAWGKVLSTTGSLASTLGTVQPFRYRGYVYDVETGLYYLRSRYYASMWQRFLNPDAYVGRKLHGGNIFSYCACNPVNRSDDTGTEWYNNLLNWVNKAYSNVSNTVSEAWNTVGDRAVAIWNDVSSWVSQAWNDVSSWVSQAWKDASSWVSKAWRDTKEFIRSIPKVLKSLVTNKTVRGIVLITGGAAGVVMGLVGLIMPDPVTTIVGTKAIITGVAGIVGGLSSIFLGVGDVIEGVSN